MLVYPHSPSDSMAQLVPCSVTFPQPTVMQQSSSAVQPTTLADFGQCQQAGNNGLMLEVPCYDGQTVPSSPTFSTWNYSPPSYWSDYNNRSPPMIKNEPSVLSSALETSNNSTVDDSGSASADSSLEELLDDYAFDYYSDIKELEESKPVIKQEEEANCQGHALLRQCLRPAADDYQQRCHLQFLNQIGSAIAALPAQETMSIKTEKAANFYSAAPAANANPAQGLASVLNLVMEQVNEEVRSTCEILGVSPNPGQWSADDVRAWLLWTSRQCALGSIPLEHFHMEGAVLIALTEEEFRSRAPHGGDTLYAKLDIWRSAWNQRSSSTMATKATPPIPIVPTIQIDEPCTDMSDLLACWINTTQDLQQPQQQSSMLSAGQHLLGVPSPGSTSSRRGALSPYSDHTHSSSEDMTSEVEEMDDEEECDEERAGSSASSRAGQTAAATTSSSSSNGSHIHLWQFLKELLSQPAVHGSAIRWLDRQRGVFKIEDSVRVAKLWGKRKNRPAMNYDKLSRSIRQYYRKGIMKKTERSQRLVYQFCQPYAL